MHIDLKPDLLAGNLKASMYALYIIISEAMMGKVDLWKWAKKTLGKQDHDDDEPSTPESGVGGVLGQSSRSLPSAPSN